MIIKKPLAGKLLIMIHIFLGIGGIYGGLAFVIEPNGRILKMTTSFLTGSPFTNYFIPGIILLVLFGITPLLVSHALITRRNWKTANRLNIFRDKHWAWTFSLYLGFALIIWIIAEAFFIKQMAEIQVVFALLGLCIQAVTLLPSVQGYYRLK